MLRWSSCWKESVDLLWFPLVDLMRDLTWDLANQTLHATSCQENLRTEMLWHHWRRLVLLHLVNISRSGDFSHKIKKNVLFLYGNTPGQKKIIVKRTCALGCGRTKFVFLEMRRLCRVDLYQGKFLIFVLHQSILFLFMGSLTCRHRASAINSHWT